MTEYRPPLMDMQFALQELVDLPRLCDLSEADSIGEDVVFAALEEAGKFASNVLSPLDAIGDRQGLVFSEGEVRTPAGFRDAYRAFVDAGWNTLSCPVEFGGQGFPRAVAALIEEMWRASSVAFTGCMTLTRGAIEALDVRGSEELKHRFLPKLIQGEWTGTMNLTEPQAGSDLSAIRTLAKRQEDGTYRVFGQKIFISWGRHDLTENVIHLVLARTPDAPAGAKGLSMFLVPQNLVGPDGSPGAPNDVRCISIENKVGQHAAPSTTMAYGSAASDGNGDGAIGYLVGELNRGLEIMFIMMNEARFAVGLEGLSASDRVLQTASAYARDRIQGFETGGDPSVRVPIIRHPDVRRMLMRMKSASEGMRALAVVVAAALDISQSEPDDAAREEARAFVDLMTPIFKGWNTEVSNELAAQGVQIHGGLGYMNECYGAQHWKDARITTIYEGTTAIQANDLVGRKIARDGGAAAARLIAAIRETAVGLESETSLEAIGASLSDAADALSFCVDYVTSTYAERPDEVAAVAVPILHAFGVAAAGWQLGRSALAAQGKLETGQYDDSFLRAKIQTAGFFSDQWMPEIAMQVARVRNGGASTLELNEEWF